MKDKLQKQISTVLGVGAEIASPEFSEQGDYSTNAALIEAKNAGKKPRELAEEYRTKIKQDPELSRVFEKVEVAGPGFINFWLSDSALLGQLEEAIGAKYGSSQKGRGKRVLVEYSAPNIAKRFGIGHLRSTIIGQAIYNLYKYLGYEVVGENHLGDWGTQFGVILRQIAVNKADLGSITVAKMERMYVDFNQEVEKNPALWNEAKEWFKKLEDRDRGAREIWEKVKEISLSEFDKIYARLGVKIDHNHGESFYEDKMPSIVAELQEKGISKLGEKGAVIVEFPEMDSVAMVLKSDGTTTYFTRDLAALKYRLDTWDPDIFVYEVGSDQTLHFRQVFAAAERLGWTKDKVLKHVAHGLFRLPEGKMSTRRGRTIRLEEVLDEACERAKKFNDDPEVAEMVGVGAVKYYDLSHAPASDIIFDWDRAITLEGNSGPYLQYTFARAQSVLNKFRGDLSAKGLDRLPGAERELLVEIVKFGDALENASENFSPNILCSYLYGLSQKFNSFYSAERIIGGEHEMLRLVLTKATANVLERGLAILGIKAPEKM